MTSMDFSLCCNIQILMHVLFCFKELSNRKIYVMTIVIVFIFFFQGSYLHLQRTSGEACPLVNVPFSSSEWKAISMEGLMDLDNTWDIVFASEQVCVITAVLVKCIQLANSIALYK